MQLASSIMPETAPGANAAPATSATGSEPGALATGRRRCYLIAAIDGNHNGDFDQARRLIDAARQAGADAVKFQKRTVEWAAVRQVLDQRCPRYGSLGPTYREALRKLEFTPEQLLALSGHAGPALGFIVAPYDVPALEALRGLPFSAVQIDAPNVVHVPLLEALRQIDLPIYACTGGCSAKEVRTLVRILQDKPLTLLFSSHAVQPDAMLVDLRTITLLRHFGRPVGYSGHAPDVRMGCVARVLGAEDIEKRLTLSRALEGPHHASSLTPVEFAELVEAIRAIDRELEDPVPRCRHLAEIDLLQEERPSLVASRPIPKGTVITREMLALKPPMRGLGPHLIDYVVGKKALYDLDCDDFITFGVIST